VVGLTTKEGQVPDSGQRSKSDRDQISIILFIFVHLRRRK
jgi:hypothetical protein